jgi:uncharacterized protein (TIGR00290 family)
MNEPVLFCWSGGKDSALALHAIRQSPEYDIAALLTTITSDYDRISMHGVRRSLLEEQAASLGHPLQIVTIPKDASNSDYESQMRAALEKYRARGIRTVAFGDIFLDDLRKYREQNLAKIGMAALFPIWKRDTRLLARKFIAEGFQAVIACVDTNALPASFAGRTFDAQFLADLPPDADPCGENGEFHSFVYDGPIFNSPVKCKTAQVVLRENRFAFCDLLPRRTPLAEQITIPR